MILHTYTVDTIKYTLLHYEKIHRGMNNKQYLLMCGIFQCSNLPAVEVVFCT
jgi:hypothetical protein